MAMRLTLRTMLAYMDDVLDPADADELKRKIEESDFASGLVDRIRGVTSKLRMDVAQARRQRHGQRRQYYRRISR